MPEVSFGQEASDCGFANNLVFARGIELCYWHKLDMFEILLFLGLPQRKSEDAPTANRLVSLRKGVAVMCKILRSWKTSLNAFHCRSLCGGLRL